MSNGVFLAASIGISVLAFLFAAWLFSWVKKQPLHNEKIIEISGDIRKGAAVFLNREYLVLAIFAGVMAALIFAVLPVPVWKATSFEEMIPNITMAAAYICGNIFSAFSGKIGIAVATLANGRTAVAAQKGIKPSFLCGFRGGAVMGMAVVGASLLGVSLVFWITGNTTALLGFSFGASSLALFAKAGGGIFTKTADVAADLTGKVELGIPEDDPRNPAVIADNVGDNVGDVAGMGADLFDSHVASMAAALVMGSALDQVARNAGVEANFVATVFCYAAIGLLASIIGIATARMGKNENPTFALNSSTYVTTFLFAGLAAFATYLFDFDWRLWGATTVGLLVGVVIGIASDYYTDDRRKPVRKTAKASESGPAFTILSGVSYGFLSTLPAMVGIGVSALVSYKLCESLVEGDPTLSALFGISMAAVGMLSIVGMIISNDAYGPIVDNARGLAEMGGLGDEVIEITDTLDSAGNTVKAVTKGFAIGAAGLTVIALLGAFLSEVQAAAVEHGIEEVFVGFDIMNPSVFFGLLVGAAIPAVFSAMLMLGVSRNAMRMVAEIHRQFKEIVGLQEGKPGVMPEYDKCIDIATSGALRELVPAGLVTILITLAVGFLGGVNAIGGYLGGNNISGLLLALFLSNAGGLWDNAKKYVESGHHGGKGSDAHKAAVIGDTIGDPFKDTAGPSINTQITVVSLIASLMSTLFLTFSIFN